MRSRKWIAAGAIVVAAWLGGCAAEYGAGSGYGPAYYSQYYYPYPYVAPGYYYEPFYRSHAVHEAREHALHETHEAREHQFHEAREHHLPPPSYSRAPSVVVPPPA